MGIQLNQVRAKQRMISSNRVLEACKRLNINPAEFLQAMPKGRVRCGSDLGVLNPLDNLEKSALKAALQATSWKEIGDILGVTGSSQSKYTKAHTRFAKIAQRHLAYLDRNEQSALGMTEEENN